MTHRSQDWQAGLAKDLRNPSFAQEFLLSLLEDNYTLQQALAKAIRAYGIKEFAQKVNMPSSNVARAINENYNPSQKTLETLLHVFRLRLAAQPVSSRKRAA